jgi:hypothetical protein
MKALVTAITLLIGFFSTADATLWTVTATGIIQVGSDDDGVFGVAGTDLTGKQVIQSISVDTAFFPTLDTSNSNYINAQGYLTGGVTILDVTVAGVSRSFSWNTNVPNFGQSMLSNGISSGANNGFYRDTVISSLEGFSIDGEYLIGRNWIQTFVNPFNSILNFHDLLSNYQVPKALNNNQYSDIYFRYGSTFFGAAQGMTSISINMIEVSSVPEPETYNLMLSGFLLVGAVTRLRKLKAK